MLVVETFSGDNLKFKMYALIGWGKCLFVFKCYTHINMCIHYIMLYLFNPNPIYILRKMKCEYTTTLFKFVLFANSTNIHISLSMF